ncbi:hypothetical protein CBS101457_000923 [Exobasidium rhododendri]|nr:hypothetical protein CBS101457_000923 [Exobasidium rhododendri]
MGLFALASSGLSSYIWLVNAWDVYHPLSATISSNTPSISPSSLLELFHPQAQDQGVPARKGRKRGHVRMENTQREEVRRCLKTVTIWLLVKGLEPLFDNSLGYLLPFYNVAKVIALLIYIRFRTQHLFESFILPLGKPNTPLLDLGAFNSIIFPTARFLLSLPFAHLVVAVKNQVNPIVQGWLGSQESSDTTASSAEDRAKEKQELDVRLPPQDRVAPPPKRLPSGTQQSALRKASGSSRGKGGDGKGGEGGGASLEMHDLSRRKKPSTESLSNTRRTKAVADLSRDPAYAMLESLPAAPHEPPLKPPRQNDMGSAAPATSATPLSLRHFAFIPPSTPISNKKPATITSRIGDESSLSHSSPRMPGSLGGRADDTYARLGEPNALPAFSFHNGTGASAITALSDMKDVGGLTTQEPPGQETVKMDGKTINPIGSRRKRVEEESDLQQPPRKTRISPSKSHSSVRAIVRASPEEQKKGGTESNAAATKALSPSKKVQSTQPAKERIGTRSRKRAV